MRHFLKIAMEQRNCAWFGAGGECNHEVRRVGVGAVRRADSIGAGRAKSLGARSGGVMISVRQGKVVGLEGAATPQRSHELCPSATTAGRK